MAAHASRERKAVRGMGRYAAVLLLGSCLVHAAKADTVEFLNGTRVTGKVKAIRKAKREFDFELTIGGKTFVRTYPFSKVHAVTLNGKRFIVTAKAAAAKPGRGASGTSSADRTVKRSQRDVRQWIEEVGATPPQWLDQTKLDYPPTLDLSWPLGAPKGGWNNQKNVGQFIWDIVNPNPRRWRAGVKLMYHLIDRHADDRKKRRRDMQSLASMYFRFFQDYARTAYWLQRSGGPASSADRVMLAECYWRLGNKRMALDLLKGKLPRSAIKLLGDMGETRRAVALVGPPRRSSARPEACLLAGDALRQAGRYREAIAYYQAALASTGFRNKAYEKRGKDRARDSIEAIRLFDQTDPAKVADGTYAGRSDGYNGPVEVEVEVAGGRIKSVRVTRHREKQFYAALVDTPRQIIAKQSVKGIDATSRATLTSQAIVHATAKALGKGTPAP